MLFLLKNNVKEDKSLSLEQIWNAPLRICRDNNIADRNNNLFPYINKIVCDRVSLPLDELNKELTQSKKSIIKRSRKEIKYIKNRINVIRNYSREKAIDELLNSEKLIQKEKFIKTHKKLLKKSIREYD